MASFLLNTVLVAALRRYKRVTRGLVMNAAAATDGGGGAVVRGQMMEMTELRVVSVSGSARRGSDGSLAASRGSGCGREREGFAEFGSSSDV